MTLIAAIRHAKLAKKAKQRCGQQLKADAEALQRQIDQDPDRILLVVQARENMFGEGDIENGYSLEQIAAADAAITDAAMATLFLVFRMAIAANLTRPP